jgi:hypothetical protein
MYSILSPPVFVEKLEVVLNALNWGPLGGNELISLVLQYGWQ